MISRFSYDTPISKIKEKLNATFLFKSIYLNDPIKKKFEN
ncbi:unknown protein [Simkania negevensis Z]|uniref:Uncharacterized protein n=1 Tax=Simkania negevensis (strain ATCC VR-1471 / DSM 27360 / Z) TaxID=331113 RepID=F8L464_SIMNZ|nr:unknown protein [Simkania negevensis Z]